MTESNKTPDAPAVVTPTVVSPVAMSTETVDAGLQFSGGDFPDNDHAESSHDENPAPLGDDTTNDPHQDNNPKDHHRTMRGHVGEAIQDTRSWPGYLLLFFGLAAFGGTLTGAAYGFSGWAILMAVVSVLCFAAGFTFVLVARKRVKAREGLNLMDQVGH